MAKEDASVASVLVNIILPIAVGIFSLIIVLRHGKHWIHKLLSFFCTQRMLDQIMATVEPYKRELFSDLENHKSHDVELRKKGSIRILEIGAGLGANFAFYPKNCNLICYEPNPKFQPTLIERCKNFPNIHLEKLYDSGAESLADIPDNSVDVAVTTLVLCAVKDVEACLKEMKRVLAPGGKYYFMEHSVAPVGRFRRKLNVVLKPLMKIIFGDDCHASKDMEKIIQNAGLCHPKLKRFQVTKGGLAITIALNDVVYGTAEKVI